MEDHQEEGWHDHGVPALGFSTTWGRRVQDVTKEVSCHPSEASGMVILLRDALGALQCFCAGWTWLNQTSGGS